MNFNNSMTSRGNHDRSTKKAPFGIATIPSFLELNLSSEAKGIEWAEEAGIIPKVEDAKCFTCGSGCRLKDPNGSHRGLKCNNKKCKHKSNARFKGTFFEGAKVTINQVINIMIMVLTKSTHAQIMQVTGAANQTVTDYMRWTHQLLRENVKEHL